MSEGSLRRQARGIVFVPDTYHYSMKNAAWVLGLGLDSVREVESDTEFRMNPEALRSALDQAPRRGRDRRCRHGARRQLVYDGG